MAASDARPVPRKNVAYRATFPILDADGDLVAGAAGLDSEISKDGGTFADCTNEATQIATDSGVYYLDLTADEMNADTVSVIVKTSTTGAKTTVLVLYPEEAGDYRADVTQISGDATAADNLEAACDGGTYNLGGGAIVAASVTAAVTAGTVSDKTGYALTSAYDAAKTAATQTSVDTVDGIVDAIKAKTDALPSDPADQSAVEAAITAATSGLATASALSTLAGYVDTEVAAILAVAQKIDGALELDGAVYRWTANALEQAPTGGGSTLTAEDVWTYATRALTDKVGFALTSAYDAAKTAAQAGDAMDLLANAVDASALAADAVAEIQAGLATSAEIGALNDVAAADVVAAIEAAVPAVNVKQINDVPLSGSGISGDEWGPA